MSGPFVSDDQHYVALNQHIHELDLEGAIALFDPTGAATIAVVNYAPIHLLLHGMAWQLFGSETVGHHVVNVLFHVLASLLLVPLLLRSGVPRVGAILGGAFFLLHPANVEAVAWISQLKSSSSLALSLLALLAVPRRPALSSALFLLALLAKPTAAFALPVAVLLAFSSRERIPWKWFAVWAGLFAVYSIAEFAVHQRSGAAEAALYETPVVLFMTWISLPGRYLVMAATSFGVSAFHEVPPVTSPLDPWFLGSLVALAALGARLVGVLRRRQPEAAWWAWAAVSYAPVSPLFPFLYQFADRYLYFILPGLIGGALLAGGEAVARIPALAGRDPAEVRTWARRGAIASCLVLLGFFAVRDLERARIWSSPAFLVADAARNYPDGVSANLVRAKRAAQLGDADTAVAGLRAAWKRGFNRFDQLLNDPALVPIARTPQFKALVAEIAGAWIESVQDRDDLSQGELRTLAFAHVARREYREARRVLERALALGGVLDDEIQRDLANLPTGP